MKKYIALWHIGDITRGEIIELGDREAEKLLQKGAIRPIGPDAGKQPEKPRREEPKAADTHAETAEPEGEPEAEDAEAEVDIDVMDAIGEAEPETETKPARKARKKGA